MEGVRLDKNQVAFKGEYCAQGMDFWVWFFLQALCPWLLAWDVGLSHSASWQGTSVGR